MNKKVLTSLLCGFSFAQIASAKIVSTTTWQAKDIKNNYKHKYFCNPAVANSTCDTNISNIKKLTGIDINNFADKKIKSIILDKITYKTINTFPATGKITSDVSGLLMLPNTNKPKGVIVYYHPTVFNNSGIPSNFKDDNIATQMFDTIYASIYALNGYIVVAPDYIGQGDDYANYHPYVFYPKQSVNTAVDLLNNSSDIIKEKYNLKKSLNLYSVGYSEGGAYSIWMAKCLEDKTSCPQLDNLDNLYSYKAANGLAGAYDLSKTMLDFMKENNHVKKDKLHNKIVTSMLKPALVANTIMSYLHYGNTSKTLSTKCFENNFFNMNCPFGTQFMCNLDGKHYSFDTLFNQKNISNIKFAGALFYSALYRKYSSQDDAAHYVLPSGNNSMYDLFDDKVFHNSELIQTAKNGDIVDFTKTTKIPLMLYSLVEDSVVTPLNYDRAMTRANSNVTGITLQNSQITTSSISWIPFIKFDISNVDHVTGEIYANIFAYKYIDDLNQKSKNK